MVLPRRPAEAQPLGRRWGTCGAYNKQHVEWNVERARGCGVRVRAAPPLPGLGARVPRCSVCKRREQLRIMALCARNPGFHEML